MLTEREKQILRNFAIIIPKLNKAQSSELLGMSKGMVMMKPSEQDDGEKDQESEFISAAG